MSCQKNKRQLNAMAPLYLEYGSFIDLGIHIAQKLKQRAKEKKKKQRQKNLNSFRRGNEAFCL